MKILNIGSLNIDHVYRVDHAVRPGETLSASSFQDFCGGKGFNQSIALARAGAEVFHAGKIGADGEPLVRYLTESGVDARHVLVDAENATGHAIIQVDAQGQNCIVVWGGANDQMTEAEADEILSHFDSGDVLLMQNEMNILPHALRRAHAKGMTIALNPSPMGNLAQSDLLNLVDIFILNEIEGAQITRMRDKDDICDALLARFPNCSVMLTLGKDGCVFARKNLRLAQSAFEVDAVDTTAAGDTFLGYFLQGLLGNRAIEDVLRTASKASAIAVSRPGAAPSIPARAELGQITLRER